jgi:hypothetical protein
MAANIDKLLATNVDATISELNKRISQYEDAAKKAIEAKGLEIESVKNNLLTNYDTKSEMLKTMEAAHEKLKTQFVKDREAEIKLIETKIAPYLDSASVNKLIQDKFDSIADIYAPKKDFDTLYAEYTQHKGNFIKHMSDYEKLKGSVGNYLLKTEFEQAMKDAALAALNR